MTKNTWPTAPIIQAAWVTPMTEETAPTYIWTRVRDGVYYSRYLNYVARKGEGYFTAVTEYWPRDYRKDEVQRLQRALTERNSTIATLREELEQHGKSCCDCDPTTFALPSQPEGPVWDRKGRKWDKKGSWWHPDNGHTGCPWSNVLAAYGPLTTTPPNKPTWHVGDTINTPEEADTLPEKTIICDNSLCCVYKYKTEWLGYGFSNPVPASYFEYPLTIIWLPDTKKEDK